MDAILSGQEKAQSVIDRIPDRIAEAYCSKRNYADVCEVIEPWGVMNNPAFNGEPLYFLRTDGLSRIDTTQRRQARRA